MKISLKQKKLKSGKITLYLEFYKGSKIDANGKEIHNRKFEYLKIYLISNPKTADKKNTQNLQFKRHILSLYEINFE